MLAALLRYAPFGFKPKGDVNDIMLTKPCYHAVLEEIGITPIDQVMI
jgi:hypothetical protein